MTSLEAIKKRVPIRPALPYITTCINERNQRGRGSSKYNTSGTFYNTIADWLVTPNKSKCIQSTTDTVLLLLCLVLTIQTHWLVEVKGIPSKSEGLLQELFTDDACRRRIWQPFKLLILIPWTCSNLISYWYFLIPVTVNISIDIYYAFSVWRSIVNKLVLKAKIVLDLQAWKRRTSVTVQHVCVVYIKTDWIARRKSQTSTRGGSYRLIANPFKRYLSVSCTRVHVSNITGI